MSIEPVEAETPANELRIPFSQRLLLTASDLPTAPPDGSSSQTEAGKSGSATALRNPPTLASSRAIWRASRACSAYRASTMPIQCTRSSSCRARPASSDPVLTVLHWRA